MHNIMICMTAMGDFLGSLSSSQPHGCRTDGQTRMHHQHHDLHLHACDVQQVLS